MNEVFSFGVKLFDSELKYYGNFVEGRRYHRKEVAEITKEKVGWSKTTTYTIIKNALIKERLSGKSQISFVVRLLHESRLRSTKQRN